MVITGQERTGGLLYKPPHVYGKHLFRIRETHVRDHYGPLLKKNALGAVKLDIAVRGVALNPEHLGRRKTPGVISGRYSYEDLHDLVRSPEIYGEDLDDPEVRRLKRKWVREQILKLEGLKLMSRGREGAGRPTLVALRDDGSGAPFDDPNGSKSNTYITVSGAIIASGDLREWAAGELGFYLVAMVGERLEANRRRRAGKGTSDPVGGGEWFQTLDWFSGKSSYRPDSHVKLPFSKPSLERGLRLFKHKGLVEVRSITKDPLTGGRFKVGRRNLYRNRFSSLDSIRPLSDAELVSTIEKIEANSEASSPAEPL